MSRESSRPGELLSSTLHMDSSILQGGTGAKRDGGRVGGRKRGEGGKEVERKEG